MKKLKLVVLSLMMIVGLFAVAKPVFASNDNIALNKTATCSSVYPNSGKTADKAVDGIIDNTTTKVSRWSTKRIGTGTPADQYDPSEEQWLLIDLGQSYSISQINIFWEGAFAKTYKLQGSQDGTEFFDISSEKATSAGLRKHNDFTSVETKYVRILCQTANNKSYGYSIFEVEVYQQKLMENSSDVIDLIDGISPKISDDQKNITLPEVPDGYEISIFGTDNEQVIRKSGKIIQPLVDMDVNVTYKVVNSNNEDDYAVSKKDAKISITGKQQQVIGDNAKPNVVPGLREWKGGQGQFTLGNKARIVCHDESQKEAAKMIQSYFKGMLNRQIEITVGQPQIGDIYLVNGLTEEEVGKEGYYLSIDDYVTITSPTYKGMIYGGTSITQILYQDEGWNNAPKGTARDYPQYEVRAGMIDVGRMYIPLEYLEEMSIYMSWFKMNEVQVHVNDYWGGSGYSAFRLESETYPSITAKDGHYTKDEYRQYQVDMKKYGVNVMTEIDTPYHSEAFKDIPGVVMKGAGSLDISTPEAFAANAEIIENLFDEYLDGDNPVIQSDKFHIGTDEYDKKYSEQMRKWTDHFINYVNDKGKKTQMWASLGSKGFNGSTPVSNEAIVNLWAPYWADVQETYDAGYDVVNTEGGWLYIVPAGNAGYPDRYNTKKLYEKFEVNNFQSDRSGTNGTAIMPFAHPQTKGASFAIWNDMTSFRTGFSWFDVYDRMKDAVSLVSEKTWFGEDEAGQTYDQFRSRIDALQNKVPNANAGRFIETKDSDVIADYDLKTSNTIVKDLSSNHYDAKVIDGKGNYNGLSFDGNGYMSLPMDSIGYPYTISMDVKLNEINENTTLLNGKDGTLYADLNGKVGYKRGDYGFTFDYTLEKNQEVNLTLICNQSNTTLFVNGKKIGNGKLTNATIGGKGQQSSTFVLPVERIFEHTNGTLMGLKIYNRTLSDNEIKEALHYQTRDNLSLDKTASASALEVTDGRFTADMAIDGEVSATSRVSFARADEQWLLVDLGEVQEVGGVTVNFESSVGQYEIQVSKNGTDFTTVYTKKEALVVGATPKIETIEFNAVETRYVRYVQKEMWKHASNGNSYSGSIYEFEIHKSLSKELSESIEKVEKQLEQYTPGTHNGQLDINYYNNLIQLLDSYKALLSQTSRSTNDNKLTQDVLESAKTSLYKATLHIEDYILYVKQDAEDAYKEIQGIDYHQYTTSSYQKFKDQFSIIEEAMEDISNYKDVNKVIKIIDDTKALLESVDNKKLVDLIKVVEDLKFDNYVNSEALIKALNDAKKVYDKPESQETIDKAYEQLLKAYNALEEKKDPEISDQPNEKPGDDQTDKDGSQPIETSDLNQIILPMFLLIGTGIYIYKKRKVNP